MGANVEKRPLPLGKGTQEEFSRFREPKSMFGSLCYVYRIPSIIGNHDDAIPMGRNCL